MTTAPPQDRESAAPDSRPPRETLAGLCAVIEESLALQRRLAEQIAAQDRALALLLRHFDPDRLSAVLAESAWRLVRRGAEEVQRWSRARRVLWPLSLSALGYLLRDLCEWWQRL